MTQGFSREPGVESPLSEVAGKRLRKVWAWSAVIALGGFLFGYDTGVISGALLFIRDEFRLGAFEQGSVVSVLLLGAMAGALGAGRPADRFGRRVTIALEGLVFVAGTAIVVASTGYWVLLLGRLVLGLAVGAVSATVPVYLSEISPKEIRGQVLTLNQLMITIGIVVSYLVDLAFAESGLWRAMFAAGAVPALLLAVGALWLPESLVWQLSHGQTDKARATIMSVTNATRADRLIEEHRRQQRAERQDREPQRKGWGVLLAARVRPALVVGFTLAAVQQFGGINTIIYYAPTIIERTGLTASNSIFYAVFIGIINLLMTIVSIRLVDRVGRRRLLLVSLAGMVVTLVLMGLSFVAGLSSLLSLVFMVLYIAAFAAGLGPVFWVMVGEIFPPSARAVGSSASTMVNWTSNFLVSLVFLTVVNAIGQGQTFWVFAAISAVGLWFVGRYVPETRNREYREVDADLQTRFGRQFPGERPQPG